MKQDKYLSMVSKAKKIWSKVAKKNGWSLGRRGVTVWIDKQGMMKYSIYNPPNTKNISFIVDHETEKLMKVIKGEVKK